MKDTAALVGRLAALTAGSTPLGERVDSLREVFNEIMAFACASADDDLAECASDGLQACGLLAAGGSEADAAASQINTISQGLQQAFAVDVAETPEEVIHGVPERDTADGRASTGDSQGNRSVVSGASASPPSAAAPTSNSWAPERDPEILGEFLSEANEHLGEAEGHLLALEKDPDNRDALSALFRGFHSIKGVASFLNFPDVERMAHAAEDLMTLARDQGGQLPAGGSDAIFETIDALKRAVGSIGSAFESGGELPPPGLAAPALIERIGKLCRPTAGDGEREARAEPEPQGVPPVGSESEPESPSEKPLDRQAGGGGRAPGGRTRRETIRVDAERLDRLVDMIGELVITESMVSRGVADRPATAMLSRHLNRMEKIVREVHELAGSLRMVPVGATFRKMARLARDVSRKSNKSVHFAVAGEDAELDKTVVDGIGDPLVHLVRNAIDHGLESDPEERERAGKPRRGTVTLRALHRGGSIHIEVEDDGRGLDPDKILARAKARGLVTGDEPLSEKQIIALICAPGFSTAERVTSISGRGVGMDVVRQQVQAMKGSLEVRSVLGKGTCFTMQLPLTLAVIDGMVMRIGEERFIMPTLSIVRLVQCFPDYVTTIAGRGEVLQLDDRLVPIVRPQEVFSLQTDRPAEMAVVLESEEGLVALMIDELIGQQQVVIKSLGDGLGDVPGLAGCAILPDGRVGMVLDVAGIMRRTLGPAPEPLREAV